jgi:hypothetical protein
MEGGWLVAGFVQYRRGIKEHVLDGRLSLDEFGAFSFILLCVNHCSHIWFGSGATLAKMTHIRKLTAQRLLVSLRAKGYLQFKYFVGSHKTYPIKVLKFSASNGTREKPLSIKRDPRSGPSASNGTSLQEVKQEQTKEKYRAQPRSAIHSPELVRQIEAKQNRLTREAETKREGKVMEIIAPPDSIKPEYWEFVRLREKGIVPKGMNYREWLAIRKPKKAKAAHS